MSTAPAVRRRSTTAASSPLTRVAKNLEAAVVRTPAMWKRSFTDTGTPWSGPRHRPAAISDSTCRAAERASSAVTVMKAFKSGSIRVTRAITASVTSTGETSRRRMRPDISARLRA